MSPHFYITALCGLLIATQSYSAITLSSIAPTVNGADQGNMTWSTTSTDSYWNDRPNPGQSFTTGSDLAGYSLSSFSYQLNSTRTASSTLTYSFRLVSISGTSSTTLVNETSQTWNGIHSSGDWITFVFSSPVTLAANSQYGVDVQHVSGGAWQDGITSIRRNGNTFADGGLYTRDDGDPTTISGNTNDRIFHVDMAVVPEPSTLGLIGLSGLLLIFRRR